MRNRHLLVCARVTLASVVLTWAVGCSSGSSPTHSAATTSRSPVTAKASTPHPSGAAASTSGSGAEGAEGAAGSQCRIVANAAVTTAFAATIGPNSASYDANSQRCSFTLVSSNVGRGVILTMSRYQAVARETFAASKAAAIASGAQAISGLGDDAYFVPSSANLQFLSGGAASALQVQTRAAGGVPSDIASVKADLIALARAVIAAG